jgi:hypothetical protein
LAGVLGASASRVLGVGVASLVEITKGDAPRDQQQIKLRSEAK